MIGQVRRHVAQCLNGNIREFLLSGLNNFGENAFKDCNHGSFKNIVQHVFKVEKLRETRYGDRVDGFLYRTQKQHTRLLDLIADGVTECIHEHVKHSGVQHHNAVMLQFRKELRLPGNVAFVFGLESECSALGQHLITAQQDAVDLGRGTAGDEFSRPVGIIGPTACGN